MPTVSGPVLCLDIGNTRVHAGIFDHGNLSPLPDLPTRAWIDGAASIPGEWQHPKAEPVALAVASVVPEAGNALKSLAEARKLPVFELTTKRAGKLSFDYPHPGELGPDRIANALAALHLAGAPAVVIDIGTAATFEVVAEPHTFIGGVIAPGPAMLSQSLHWETALLPRVKTGGDPVRSFIGRSTTEAISIGCTVGFEGLLHFLHEGILRELNERSTRPVTTVVTGGGATPYLEGWPSPFRHEPQLTLLGVGLAATFSEFQ